MIIKVNVSGQHLTATTSGSEVMGHMVDDLELASSGVPGCSRYRLTSTNGYRLRFIELDAPNAHIFGLPGDFMLPGVNRLTLEGFDSEGKCVFCTGRMSKPLRIAQPGCLPMGYQDTEEPVESHPGMIVY